MKTFAIVHLIAYVMSWIRTVPDYAQQALEEEQAFARQRARDAIAKAIQVAAWDNAFLTLCSDSL